MLGQTVGFPVPEGGAGRLTQALAAGSRPLGGEIRCRRRGRPGRRRRRPGDRRRTARRRAGTPPGARWSPTSSPRTSTAAWSPATTLPRPDRPRRCAPSSSTRPRSRSTGRWTARSRGRRRRPYAPGTVHVADSVEQMTEALGQVAAGRDPGGAVPAGRPDDHHRPDPLAGGHRVAVGLHPRPAARRAATPATAGIRGAWDRDDCERFADRMQARIERLAPGLRRAGSSPAGSSGPRELEARDANLHRRRPQRRHGPAAPAAGLPSGARPRPRRDPGPGPLPRLGLRPPRRRRARRPGHERRPRGPRSTPACARSSPAAGSRVGAVAPRNPPSRRSLPRATRRVGAVCPAVVRRQPAPATATATATAEDLRHLVRRRVVRSAQVPEILRCRPERGHEDGHGTRPGVATSRRLSSCRPGGR